MKRFIILLALMGVMLTVSPSTAMAQDTGTVNATVTPSFISLSLNVLNIGYGSLFLSDVNKEPLGQECLTSSVAPAFTVTNNGTAAEKFQIKGVNSSPGTWLINTGVGANSYVHRFSTVSVPSDTCSFTVMTDANVDLVDSVAKDTTINTFLQLDMPSSSSSNELQTLNVIILATAA